MVLSDFKISSATLVVLWSTGKVECVSFASGEFNRLQTVLTKLDCYNSSACDAKGVIDTSNCPTSDGVVQCNMNGFVDYLYLLDNMLSGVVPSELGSLTMLTSLWLYNNMLSGVLPSELGLLQQLQYLSLYNNMLSGVVPTELGSLQQLRYL